MKRAKRLFPRLLAVGVILGIGAISIVQGIHDTPTNPSNAESTDSDAQTSRVLTPVASLGLDNSQPYADTPSNSTPSNSQFSQDSKKGTNQVATAPSSQFNDTGSSAVIPEGISEVSNNSNRTQEFLSKQAGYSRFSATPLPVETREDFSPDQTSSKSEMDTPVDDTPVDIVLATNISDRVDHAEQNDLVTDKNTAHVNRLRADQLPSYSDTESLPGSELPQVTLPVASLPLTTEVTEAEEITEAEMAEPNRAAETFDPLAGEASQTPEVALEPTTSKNLSGTADNAFQDDTSASEALETTTNSQPNKIETLFEDQLKSSTDDSEQHNKELTSVPNQHNRSSIPSTDFSTSASRNSIQKLSEADQDSVAYNLGKPGPRILEGLQTPSLTIEKQAPSEIQIGKMAELKLTVRNVGKVPASHIVIQDQVPEGTRFVGATPEISNTQGNSLYWELDTLAPGDKLTVAMQVMPETEGEIGSVGKVTFQAEASFRTVATRPLLVVEQSVPSRAHVGDAVQVKIRVSNPGNGDATSVVLEEDVPDGLSHPAGTSLERAIGTIRPNEMREVELTLSAEKAGLIDHIIIARADANLVAEDRAQIEVVAPNLQIAVSGPAKRYLERQATYALSVENHGTAPAQNVELVAHLPKGMKFIETNNAGQYDPRTHAVYWSLEELPAKQSGEVQLVTLPIEPGEQKLRFEGQADWGLKDSQEKAVLVDGLPSLFFEVADTADPIEVSKETTYEIRLVNEGSKYATEIVLLAELPPGLKPVDANGPERSRVNGQQITFQPLARLAPGSDVYYKIRVQGVSAGHQLIRVQVQSREMQVAVTEEEDTLVYTDQ